MADHYFSESTKLLFKENENRANRLISKSFLILAAIYLIIAICTITEVFAMTFDEGLYFFGGQTLIFVLLSFFIKNKADKSYTKYIAIISLLIAIGAYTTLYSYGVELMFAIPIVLSCRYYSKRVTLNISICTLTIYIIAKLLSSIYGIWDLNMINFTLPTVLNIDPSVDATPYTAIDSAISALSEQDFSQFLYLYNRDNFFYCLDTNIFFLLVIILASFIMTKRMQEMVHTQADISSKKAAVESELKMGTSIQINMLPHNFPANENVSLFATMTPAKEVGGDFYDFFFIDESHLGVVMADVSGKGVPAALFMVIAKTLIKDHAQLGLSPVDVFNNVNQKLCESEEDDMFVTAWFGILDTTTGQLDYVNAGHNPPLLCKNGGKFEYLVSTKKRLPLAAMSSLKYTQESISLNAGDQLFLYTDGVTEATNTAYEFYGENRLQQFADANSQNDLHGFLHGLKADIDKFADKCPQADDITMMLVRYNAPKAS